MNRIRRKRIDKHKNFTCFRGDCLYMNEDVVMNKICLEEFYYHILFNYIINKSNTNFDKERFAISHEIVFNHILSFTSDTFRGKRIDFFGELQKKIELEMEKIISKKSIYYWFYLYRRIGIEKSFGGESYQTLHYYRNILETAFQKYGKRIIGEELVFLEEKSFDECVNLIANGLFAEALRFYEIDIKDYVDEKLVTKSAFGKFGKNELLEIYTLEVLAFEYWKTTACVRRLNKGGILDIDYSNFSYSVVCSEETEFLMKSFDTRCTYVNENTTSSGILLESDESSDSKTYLPVHNIFRLDVKQTGMDKLFSINAISLNGGSFVNNFIWQIVDLKQYYNANCYLEIQFKKTFGYTLESFVGVIYIILTYGWANGLGNYKIVQTLQRSYMYIDSIDEFKMLIVALNEALKNNGQEGFAIDTKEMIKIINRFILPKDRKEISLTTLGPRYPLFPAGEGYLLDYVAFESILHTELHKLSSSKDEKGPMFERIINERLNNIGYQMWEHKTLYGLDGSKKEVDVSFIYKGYLFLGEQKTKNRALNYIAGGKKSLEFREKILKEALQQVEDTANWLKDNPMGTNYEMPNDVIAIIPFVITPFVEYIWSKDSQYWITDTIPRICTPKECEMLCKDEVIEQIKDKPYVVFLG